MNNKSCLFLDQLKKKLVYYVNIDKLVVIGANKKKTKYSKTNYRLQATSITANKMSSCFN